MITIQPMLFLLRKSGIIALAIAALLAASVLSGCVEKPTVKTTVDTTPTSTAPPYKRQAISFFRGIDEPRPDAWEDLVLDRGRLKDDGFNTVTLSPPVLITQRAGGKPRIILEGAAGSVPGLADEMHNAGFGVFIAPTTAAAGYQTAIEVTDSTLTQLTEDVKRWAQTAEEHQAELFSPLADYNLALGTANANKWSAQILPLVRQKFNGSLVAVVRPDLSDATPAPGTPHDFENLDFKGYDYLMLDIYPRGATHDAARLATEVDSLLTHAEIVRARDGLKGIMIETGSWREQVGTDTVDGPLLGDDGQAEATSRILQVALPRVQGFFWHGWNLPGRGAKRFKVEQVLQKSFTGT